MTFSSSFNPFFQVRDVEVFRITQTTFAPFSSRANLELVQEVGKLLASGQFFFAWPSYGAQFDLLACAQKQGKEQRQFFWSVSNCNFCGSVFFAVGNTCKFHK